MRLDSKKFYRGRPVEEIFEYLGLIPEETFRIKGKLREYLITSDLKILEQFTSGSAYYMKSFIGIDSLLSGEYTIIHNNEYERMKEMEGKKNQMKLEDLKSGYVVQLRDDRYFMILRVGRFTKGLVNAEQFIYLSEYDDELRSKSTKISSCTKNTRRNDLDIMKVYGLIQGNPHYTKALDLAPSISYRELLWSREEAVKLTMKELCERLGYEVEIVKE